MARDHGYDVFKKRKSARLKRFRHGIEYALVMGFVTFANLWSIKTNQKVGLVLGWIAYRLARKDRDIARYQLDFCFPESSAAEKETIVREMFGNLGQTLLETLVIGKFRRNAADCIKLVDVETVREATAEGKGALLVFGHLANWELLVLVCEMLDIYGMAVYSPIGEKRLDDVLMAHRKSEHIKAVSRTDKMLALSIMKSFRRNEFFVVAFDQDMKVPSVFVDFFGRRASTSKNIATLAQKYDAPVLSAFGTRLDDGTHEFRFALLSKGPYHGGEAEVGSLTQSYSRALEEHIRRNPSQWVWNHRRWKNQPDDESAAD
ncbi:MAG: lysophospholipid acyltransferase family protein [Proteobacteria bacterium]|nr:lysophospholipid acyltransferase family protein [Pseudomonadota bacterium]